MASYTEAFVLPEINIEVLNKMPTEELKTRFYNAMLDYATKEIEPSFTGIEKAIWIGLKYYIDISNNVHKERTCAKYRLWRTTVFQRDNYTCQLCGQKGGKLNAHHIKRFAKDIANRFNVANGVTLCVDCHKYVHKVEGR